jgi:hypothetical protein
MTLLAFAAVAVIMAGQQSAPLVNQTELPPPPAVQQQAPRDASPPQAVQPAPQTQEKSPVPPVEPAAGQAAPGRNETKGPGGKRVVAFWVILPDSTK